MSESPTIIDLPEILLEMILSYLSYDEIAKYRIVCRTFNEKCKQMLNKGSKLMEKSCMEYLNVVKAQLPRRESEKNHHPLLPSFYVLESIKTSLVKLTFTYDKYMQANLCCFIPGKIIDESFKIIRHLKAQEMSGKPLTFTNVQEVLKEFNDIKGLAIEHFEDHIQPIFERSFQDDIFNADSKSLRSNDRLNVRILAYRALDRAKDRNFLSKRFSPNRDLESPENSEDYAKKFENQEAKMREYIDKIEKQESKMKEYVKKIEIQDLKMREYTERMKSQDAKIQEYTGKIRSQDLKMQEYDRKIQNQDAQLAKVSKSLDDLNQKLRSIGIGLIQD